MEIIQNNRNRTRLFISRINEFPVMANQDTFIVFSVKMHGTAKAIFVNLTIFADACFHPAAVAKELKTVFPYV